MNRVVYMAGAAAFVTSAVFLVGMQVRAEPTRATMPEIDKLIHYTTVERGRLRSTS